MGTPLLGRGEGGALLEGIEDGILHAVVGHPIEIVAEKPGGIHDHSGEIALVERRHLPGHKLSEYLVRRVQFIYPD